MSVYVAVGQLTHDARRKRLLECLQVSWVAYYALRTTTRKLQPGRPQRCDDVGKSFSGHDSHAPSLWLCGL
jgi:hypothetical protein